MPSGRAARLLVLPPLLDACTEAAELSPEAYDLLVLLSAWGGVAKRVATDGTRRSLPPGQGGGRKLTGVTGG